MTQDKAAAPDIKAIRAAATRREVAVRICVAGELSADAERLDAELRRLDALTKTSLADGSDRARLVEELDAVIALMRENEFEFRFRALPSRDYSDLLAAHPSKKPDELFDAEAFPIALIAASCISPVMTVEDVEGLFDDLPQGGRNALWETAWSANRGEVRIPSSRAVSATPSLSDAR